MRRIGVLFALAVTAVLIVAAGVGAHNVREIDIRDKCDPATFNAAIGEGTCVGDGNVTFEEFLEELPDGGHGAWRFNPDDTHIDEGGRLDLFNEGGETHTFTAVAEFGGGFIPLLNEAVGNAPTVDECQDNALVDRRFIAAGANDFIRGLGVGMHRFQCCIHPWMRTVIEVREDD